MKIKQLHYFMAIAEYLNYKYASEAIDVSPSLLSQQIVGLEEELGVELFERNKKNVKLTPAGEELKKRIPEIEDLIGETLRVASKMRENQNGMEALHIGYEHIFDQSLITRHLLSLKAEQPQIHCMMRQHTPEELSVALSKNEIDCAFMVLPTDVLDSTLEIRTIKKDRLVLLTHKDLLEKYGKEQATAVLKNTILYGFLYNTYGTETIINISRSLGVRPKVKICASLDEMLSYVESALGCAILPESFVKEHIDNPDVEIIYDERISETICMSLVYDRNHISNALSKFMERFDYIDPKCAECDHIFCMKWEKS